MGTPEWEATASMIRYWISTSVVTPGTWFGYTGGSGVSRRSTNRPSSEAPAAVQAASTIVVSAENPLPGLPASATRTPVAPGSRASNQGARAEMAVTAPRSTSMTVAPPPYGGCMEVRTVSDDALDAALDDLHAE